MYLRTNIPVIFVLLFVSDEVNANNYLDQRSRGSNFTQHGEVTWCIDDVDYNFTDGRSTFCHEYCTVYIFAYRSHF